MVHVIKRRFRPRSCPLDNPRTALVWDQKDDLRAGETRRAPSWVLQLLYSEVKSPQDNPLGNSLTDNFPQSPLWRENAVWTQDTTLKALKPACVQDMGTHGSQNYNMGTVGASMMPRDTMGVMILLPWIVKPRYCQVEIRARFCDKTEANLHIFR